MKEETPDRWQCVNGECATVLNKSELKRFEARDMEVFACPHCGDRVMPVLPSEPIPKTQQIVSFFSLITSTFVYPFIGRGRWILALVTVLFGLTQALVHLIPIIGWIVYFFILSYLVSYFFEIVLTTVNGDDEPPSFPDVTDLWQSILRPFFLMLGAVAFSFAPVWLYWLITKQWLPVRDPWEIIRTLLLVSAGVIYFPMALLAVILFDSMNGLHPIRIVPAIRRVWLPYLVVCVFLATLVVCQTLLQGILNQRLPSLWAYLIIQSISLYCAMVIMRLLGILYRSYKERLAWF